MICPIIYLDFETNELHFFLWLSTCKYKGKSQAKSLLVPKSCSYGRSPTKCYAEWGNWFCRNTWLKDCTDLVTVRVFPVVQSSLTGDPELA